MKLYAYAREEGDYRLIDVWEAARIRDREPELFSKLRYYSTELNLDKRRELVLVRREGRLFFRYKEQPEEPVSATAQTLTHLKAKEILSRMRRLRFLLPGGELTLWVQGWSRKSAFCCRKGDGHRRSLLRGNGKPAAGGGRSMAGTAAGGDYRNPPQRTGADSCS